MTFVALVGALVVVCLAYAWVTAVRYAPGCPSCGARMRVNAVVCGHCGHEILVARGWSAPNAEAPAAPSADARRAATVV